MNLQATSFIRIILSGSFVAIRCLINLYYGFGQMAAVKLTAHTSPDPEVSI